MPSFAQYTCYINDSGMIVFQSIVDFIESACHQETGTQQEFNVYVPSTVSLKSIEAMKKRFMERYIMYL